MPLTPRERFRLKISLAQKYQQPDAARQVATVAGINTLSIPFNGTPPIDLWEKIILKAEKSNRLLPLVKQVATQHPDDTEYPDWLRELETGIPERLRKLAQSIRDGHCLLFLGPGTLLCEVQEADGGPLQTTTFNRAFAKALASDMQQQNIYYDEREASNLAYIAQRYSDLTQNIPGMQAKLAQEFYETCQPDTRLYELLAQLPFRIVINTNPDNELATLLNQQTPGRCVHRYYSLANAQDGLPPTGPRPLEPGQLLLYNIFGWFGDRPSMILTESQLLDFTNRILNRNPALDPQVMEEFTAGEDSPKSYLFLGFDFDQWYVKIVFQTVLKLIKQKDRAFSIFPKGLDYKQFNREFFEEEFKCYFIDDDLGLFLRSLQAEYEQLPMP
ncbi:MULTISPECIES: SIR2 family protein [Spirosoma]|uniref:Effector-associated domain-containing protein n=1 Tax=Spirosoma sordidisoli TaxID=2502893 RepID=A0A4Q2UGU7_9BACT|nr:MULTISPECIES: SIR2 family protein [Spirosoma]RYC68577.1 hypothetical protein EQG79_19720 [Spirosoma sordidisoli]